LNAQALYHTYVRGEVAAVISFAVALMLCAMAIFRVGSLMKFISPSVLTGFVTGRYVPPSPSLPPSFFQVFLPFPTII